MSPRAVFGTCSRAAAAKVSRLGQLCAHLPIIVKHMNEESQPWHDDSGVCVHEWVRG